MGTVYVNGLILVERRYTLTCVFFKNEIIYI